MSRWRRLLFFLLINVLISACTTLLVLTIWQRYNPAPLGGPISIGSGSATASPVLQTPELTRPASDPTPAFQVYQVEAGDTLAGIAAQFGMSIEELLHINGLADSDSVAVGEVLFVFAPPAFGGSGPAPTAAANGPGAQTPVPVGTGLPIQITAIIAAGVLQDERVLIQYNGDGELSLLNWELEDDDGLRYIFPQLTLFKGGAVSVFTKAGADNAVELYWGRSETAWQVGETATLRDPQGQERATYRVP